jgi:biopolymer transport protein ExbD
MSKRRGIKLSEDKTDINISPMIDMVFILLIFFIVTTVFVDERGFDAEKPTPSQNPPQEDDSEGPVKFTIQENGNIYFKGSKISLNNVRQKVAERTREDPETVVIVECHPSIKSSVMILVMDEARMGKAKNISVDTTE